MQEVFVAVLVDPETRAVLPGSTSVTDGKTVLADAHCALNDVEAEMLEVECASKNDDDGQCPGCCKDAPDSATDHEKSEDGKPYATTFDRESLGSAPLQENGTGGICVQIIKL